MEINTINKNCPATPVGNFKAKKPATTKIGIMENVKQKKDAWVK